MVNRVRLGLCVTLVLLSIGCASQPASTDQAPAPVCGNVFRRECFNRVERGMSQGQVRNLLGRPDDTFSGREAGGERVCWRYFTDGRWQVCFLSGTVDTKAREG